MCGAGASPGATPANGTKDQRPRQTLRFFWETDAQNRFTINSDAFIALAGPRTANLLGRFWGEISAKLALDPEGRVAQALVSRNTWSGIDVDWPIAEGGMVAVSLSGIPTFDRDRSFRGYRGLGVWQGEAAAETAATIEPIMPAPQGPAEPVAPAAAAPDRSDVAREDKPVAAPPIAQVPVHDEARSQTDDAPPQPENVVPFRIAGSDQKAGGLNPAERNAFRDLGSRLSARLKGADELARGLMEKADPHEEPPYVPPAPVAIPQPQAYTQAQALPEFLPEDDGELSVQRPVLEKLPFGILIYRGSNFIYANPAFLKFAGHGSLPAFSEAGGLDSMFVEFDGAPGAEDGQRLRIAAGDQPAAEGRLTAASIDGENAMVLMLQPSAVRPPQQPPDAAAQNAELAALLDIAVDGVVSIDRNGTIVSANAGAEKLFGYDSGAMYGRPFGDLFAPESERIAKGRLDRLCRGEAASDGDGREVIGRRRQGELVSLQLMLGRADEAATRFHALFRDMTRWKDAEKEMTVARQQAEKASAAKSEFLAKISHEMRTPLNAIIGFSEVMMEERFGPVGNERYRDYLKDINTSGSHLVSLLNDLLDLSKIEAGKMELSFERVNLNELTQQSVAIMQPQAARARVVVRSALSMSVPDIIADARSVRQIVLNLLSNSIKFTSAGGQVIVSTAATERGEVMLRVRDTGIGMSAKDIEVALQPFRQLTASPRSGENGTGLGLPLTKALVEANRARFSIKSAVNAGTLVEIVFPAARVLPE
jgi:PAS domain S-box-containing protein